MAGLTTYEANLKLAKFGPNQIADQDRLPGLAAFLSRFKNPLVIILLLAATLSAFLGDVVSFGIILAIVTLSVLLDFINTYKSEKAALELKDRVRVTTSVLRSGKWVDLPLSQIVPGDIVRLAAGNLIPADAKLIECKDLYINESALTGESFPQLKAVGEEVYLGSSVISGNAQIEVTATGKQTKFSHIAAAITGADAPTEFDREMSEFSFLIVRLTFGLVIFIFAVNALLRHDLLESLLFSLALAVGLTPELLPLIITLNLTKGSLAMAKHGVIVKRLSAIQNFGSMDVLCTDKTGTLTEDRIALVKYVNGFGDVSEEVLRLGYLTCVFSTAYENPLDRAIKAYRHPDIDHYEKLDEIPYDFSRKAESVVVRRGHTRQLITKGAPEEILARCAFYDDDMPLGAAMTKKIQAEYERLSSDGFRVLAVATRQVGLKTRYEPTDEIRLTFRGFVAFLDPAKESVSATLEQLLDHGIEVKIITGDNALVTQKIAHDIHLSVKGILTGTQLDKLNVAQLAKAVEANTIFARVSPEQKMRLIQAMQRNGHVVGYMGDGINDAPSLRAADIGISVNNAVDVAKATADLILLHKSLHELVGGVIEGRKTFANTLKYLMMSLSSNFGNMFSMAGASLFLPFLPMLATQILLNNLLYDSSQFAIPLDNVDPDSLKSPHKLKISSIKRFMLVFGPLSSAFDFLTFGALYLVFQLGAHGFQTGWFIESMLTQVLVVYIIRTGKIPFVQSRPSLALVASTLLAVCVAIGIVYSPIAGYFHFEPLSAVIMAAIVAIVAVYLIVAELTKRAFYRHFSF